MLFTTILLHLSLLRITSALLPPAARRRRQLQHQLCRTTTARCWMTSFADFLQERYENPTSHIVLGNPAGDADSILSALTLAYVDHHDDEDNNNNNNNRKTPVVSISRADLQSQRPETTLLLDLAGLSSVPLWFREDLDQLLLQSSSNEESLTTKVTLVDHNRHVLHSHGQVVEIFDHHLDEGYHPEAEPRIIAFENSKATVASTGTLVVERWLWQQNVDMPADVSLLLLGLLLIDSVNLSPAAGKATLRDAAAIETLLRKTKWETLPAGTRERLQIIKPQRPQPNTQVLFDALQGAKFDPAFWEGLTVRDALRLDFKEFTGGSTRFGMSSVLLPMASFLQKETLTSSIHEYMDEIQVDLLVVMLAYTDDESNEEKPPLKRQLILCGRNGFVLSDLVTALATKEPGTLQLQEVTHEPKQEDNLTLRFFNQDNPKASRKQVAPILIQYFDDHEENTEL